MSEDKLQAFDTGYNEPMRNAELMINDFFDCYHMPELKEEL